MYSSLYLFPHTILIISLTMNDKLYDSSLCLITNKLLINVSTINALNISTSYTSFPKCRLI